MTHPADRRILERLAEREVEKWAGIIRAQKPRGRIRRWWWRRHWLKVQAGALAAGGTQWEHTIRQANRRAGVTDTPHPGDMHTR